ncbi:MAG: helicase [Prevotella sp.]|nr:helicase [Prevotella sp.]
MKTNSQKETDAKNVSQAEQLAVELFLHENYLFRRNILSGKVEYSIKNAEEDCPKWLTLTQEDLNSIIIHAKRMQVCETSSPKTDIMEFINSREVERFNPIESFLSGLPKWDGQNHVGRLFSRVPGVDSERLSYLSTWMRSMVAHWLQMDTIHGNECVPTLIGAQGCGKTTFIVRMLPPELRVYYLDHLNLSNKFDKEMALTNNLLVNLDELEAIRPSQHAALKQTLSKNKVNGRPIYGASQEDRPRYASFVATTNNPHPLTDATGSRRYICLTIPKGQYIDNTGEIDYEQLYAQVLYELQEQQAPYWFNNEEVARIQLLNVGYMEKKDMADMVSICFRKPANGECAHSMTSTKLLEVITTEFPTVNTCHSTKICLGRTMKALGYDSTDCGHITHYKVIPLKVA